MGTQPSPITSAADALARVGNRLGPSEWLEVTQDMVTEFGRVTGDMQWIHVEPERAAGGPFVRCIAHGLFTLSLAGGRFFHDLVRTTARNGVNYGSDRVRYPAPVPVGSRVRASAEIVSAQQLEADGVQMSVRVTIMPFEPSASGSYTQTLLVREPIILVGQATSGLDPALPVPIEAMGGAQWIIPGRSNLLRQQIEHAFARRNIPFRITIETDTWGLCLEFVTQGLGVAIAPASALQGRPPDPRVRWAPIRGVYVTWALHENQSRSHSEGVRAGRDLVLKTVVERVGAGWLGAQALENKGNAAQLPSTQELTCP